MKALERNIERRNKQEGSMEGRKGIGMVDQRVRGQNRVNRDYNRRQWFMRLHKTGGRDREGVKGRGII